MREVQDHYFREAKREGYLSRAAYKLIEIDDRRAILHPGDAVLDLGAAPGSWMQVAAKRVGAAGVVIGVDLNPITQRFSEANVRFLQADVHDLDPQVLLKLARRDRFDVVLSDMGPGTTGDPRGDHFRSAQLCDRVLGLLPQLLRTGGGLVMKVYEGERYPEILDRASCMFDRAKGFKPKASRRESVEMFLIGTSFKGASGRATVRESDQQSAPARPKPRAGWSNR